MFSRNPCCFLCLYHQIYLYRQILHISLFHGLFFSTLFFVSLFFNKKISFYDDFNQRQRLWAVDLNLGMTRSHIVFTLTNFLLRGNVETASGEYMVRPMASSDLPTAILPNIEVNEESKDFTDSEKEKELSLLPPLETRSYVAIDCLYHPNLGSMQYGSFFNLCRLHGISFDLQQKLGTAFMLTDTLASGIIGLIGVGNDTNDAMKMVRCLLLFVVCCCLF